MAAATIEQSAGTAQKSAAGSASDEAVRQFVESGSPEGAHCSCFVSDLRNVDGADYMRWNTQGFAPMHRDPARDEPVARLEAALPPLRQPYPFAIGTTGYVELIAAPPPETCGKAKDALGRNVFVVGPRILFQRYVEGNCYMIKTWLEPCAPEKSYYNAVEDGEWPEIVAQAEARAHLASPAKAV
jgi:hypothetical protein